MLYTDDVSEANDQLSKLIIDFKQERTEKEDVRSIFQSSIINLI